MFRTNYVQHKIFTINYEKHLRWQNSAENLQTIIQQFCRVLDALEGKELEVNENELSFIVETYEK